MKALSAAQVRALLALNEIETVLTTEGEHHCYKVLVSTFRALVSRGLASELDGRFTITDSGREEAKHWPV